jgi:hypothetical protein
VLVRRLALLASLALLGCVHRGASWQARASTSDAPGVELIAIGQPRAGRATRIVARELASQLDHARAAGRTSVVLWLGHDLGPAGDRSAPCPTRSPWQAPGMRELAAVLDEHVAAGGALWGVAGPDALRCPAITEGPAIAQPDAAYLVRVHAEGRSELASRCDAGTCSLAPAPAEAPLLELVFVDPSAWIYPELDTPGSRGRAALDELDLLLAALAEQPGPPRVLVTPIPIESAGMHGFGGARTRAALRLQPDALRRAIAEGRFVGVIAGLERDLQASSDLADAILRSNRSFVPAPLFQVVAGAAGGTRPTTAFGRGNSLVNELESDHPGFARVHVAGDVVELELVAHVRGRWRSAALALPLVPAPLPALRDPPTIQPCLRCDVVRGAADGEVWFDR